MSNLEQGLADQFTELGYCVLLDDTMADAVRALRVTFENQFERRFADDPVTNRNLIKRFGDTFEVARLFSSPLIEAAASAIGIREPVYCGPVVTHYTSNDLTGQSYGLPFHQDWPSMGSSTRSAIFWLNLADTGNDSHGLEIVPGAHRTGLLPGTQEPNGYVLDRQDYDDSEILSVAAGTLVIMSPFLPHRTYVNPESTGWKLSLSRRLDDLQCPEWPSRKYANAYATAVDRDLFRTKP